ncbi:hypothetical protein M758_8G193100 [Ceratodon purpureus]|nr:hypothetical protein M758_8G193100 [Ceratodon purpureus]
MHDGGADSIRRLTISRNLEKNKEVMAEPKAKMDLLAPFASEVKASVNMFDGKNPIRTHSLPQPYLLHPPTHHVGAFYHLSPKAAVDPGHYAQTIVTLEAELQRAHKELNELKEQLAVSETGKAQALKEFTNIKNLLDQISLVEHFAASDNVEVEAAPLPPNWSGGYSGQVDLATQKEIERLRNELEASKNLNSKFAAELDKAKQEMDEIRHRRASFELENSRLELIRSQSELERDQQGNIYLELDNAKKDISTLQATLSDAWSHHGACALELARAKDEIAWLEADLEASQNLTAELAHAKDDINMLHEDLEVARGLQKSSSMGLSKAKEKISRLRSQHEASSSELAIANNNNSALQADLEDLRGLYEASTTELQNAKQEILKLRVANESTILESGSVKDEIRRLQGELSAALASGRNSAAALRDREEMMGKVQSKLEFVKGQYDSTSTELSEATKQIEKLRAELEALRVNYENCSSELFNVKEDVFRLEVEQLASYENLMTDIRIAQEENLKLQGEVAALKAEKISLSVELAEAREEINHTQGELEAAEKRNYTASSEIFSAEKDIARLQCELSAIQGQHKDCFEELEIIKDISTNFQTEVTYVQELHTIVMAELINAREEISKLQLVSTEEFENSLEVVKDLKEEIGEVQADFSMQYTTLILEKSLLEQKTKDLTLELIATNTRLQEASAAQKKAETELAATPKENVGASALRAELEAVRAELVIAREAENKLEKMTLEVEELRAQMAFRKQSMTTELSADMDALRTELDAVKKSEANYREIVNSSQAQIEGLKVHVYALRDSEAKAKESLVSISSELQKKKIEFEMAKEALEWVGGDAAALSAELEALKAEVTSMEALRAEVTSTKEGEARAKAAFTDYSLKLQKMRLDLEDATKLADKVPIKAQPIKTQARTFKLDLDEATEKLVKAIESEKTMSASMASLKAELNNARTELAATREEHGLTLAEKEQQYELELNQMRAQWEVASISEATLTDANFALNESLIKVMAEAEEAVFAKEQATQDAEKARQEVEQAEDRIETLEAKLETLQLEVEAAKASEEWAFTQMRLKTIPEYDMETEEQDGEIPVSFEEYQHFKTKAKELQELVNKRAAVGMAQVNAAKASEKEMQRRIETIQKELRTCRIELNEAITKREEAEAAKFSCEAALRAKRLERKSLSHSGTLNGGHPMGKLMNVEDRQGSLNSICFEDSQSSSPSRSSKSFASFASPGRSERSPMESIAQALHTRTPSEEKQRKLKFSSKIGAYFSKKKDSSVR